MIECPICHVMNEDGAHFCAECGQRFSPSGPPQPPALGTVQPGFNQPPGPPQSFSANPNYSDNPPDNQWNQMPNSDFSNQSNKPNQGGQHSQPDQPKKRLHSPILGGGYEDEPEPEPEVKRGRASMRGGGQDASSGKPKHLRSPLLGGDEGDDDDFDDEPRRPSSRGQRPTTKGGLRSPLLGGADDDDDYDEPQSRGGFPRRTRDSQDDDVPERGSGRGLRSPLLGGGDDEDSGTFSTLRRTNRPAGNFPNDRRSKPDVWDPGSEGTSGKRPRLRSSLLGGGSADDYDDYDDEDEEISDPKALRSPLLRAVTSQHDQPQTGKSQPQQPPSQPQPASQQYQQAPDPGYGNQQDAGSPLFRQPLTPPQTAGGYFDAQMQQMQQQQMQPQAPQPGYAQTPQQPPPASQLQQASSPFAREPAPTLIEQPVPARLSTSSMPTTVKPSKPARFQPQADDDDVPSRPSFDKFASDAPDHSGGGSVSPLIAGLCALAILLKGWYFISYPSMWNQAPFVADQFAEILVMVAVIIVVMGVSKGRN